MGELWKRNNPGLNFANAIVAAIHRVTNAKVLGKVQGAPLGLLTTTGRRSKDARLRPVCYGREGDRFIVMGTAGGSPRKPSWVYNIRAEPKAHFEIGKKSFDVTAVEITGAERDRLWAWMCEQYPVFLKYPKKTDRVFPIFALEPGS